MKNKPEIFISYRRDGGEFVAKKLRDTLVKAHYHAFLDIEGLGSGNFNEHLLEAIDSSDDYILVLSKNCLDRCVNEDDWVRREIEYSHSKNKHIIILVNKEFSFPETLPESCKFLSSSDIEKIEYENLDDIPLLLGGFKKILKAPCHKYETFTNKILPLFSALVLVSCLTVGIVTLAKKIKEKFPKTQEDEILIEKVFDYVDSALTLADNFSLDYIDLLDSCIEVADNYETADYSVPVEKFESLWGFINTINFTEYELPSDLDSALEDSKFSKEDVRFLISDIEAELEIYKQNITGVAKLFYFELDEDPAIISSNKTYFESLRQQLFDGNQNYLIFVNGILNPISKKYQPFIDFKNNVLSKYKTIDFSDYIWLTNKEIESIYSANISDLENALQEQQKNVNNAEDYFYEFYEDIIKNLMDAGLTREESIKWIEQENEIDKKKMDLTTKMLNLATDRYKLKQLLVYEKEDTNDRLYYKTIKAFSNGFYDVTAENLNIFEEKFPDYIDNISDLNKSFAVFAANYGKYDFNGIVVVNNFRGEFENQKYFHLGDIILSVDGKTFANFDEFASLRSSGMTTLQVLHNNNGILEEKNITCEGILGLQLMIFEGE
jgi:hypothetical protein